MTVDEGRKDEAAEDKGPLRRRRGGRRRRGVHSDKKWTSKDGNLLDLILTMAKLLLQTTQRTRALQASSMDTIQLPVTHAVVIAIGDELDLYKNELDTLRKGAAEDKKKLATIGPPTAALAVAMIESLAQCDVGGAMKTALNDFLNSVQPKDDEQPTINKSDIEDSIAFLRLEACHDKANIKLQIAMNQWQMRSTVLQAFRAEGVARVMTGVAPPGWLEEELGTWVDTLASKA